MPLYVGDYLSATTRLTTEQHGAYFLLLLDYWKSGPPPNDDAVLAQIARMPLSAWRKAKPALIGFVLSLLVRNREEGIAGGHVIPLLRFDRSDYPVRARNDFVADSVIHNPRSLVVVAYRHQQDENKRARQAYEERGAKAREDNARKAFVSPRPAFSHGLSMDAPSSCRSPGRLGRW